MVARFLPGGAENFEVDLVQVVNDRKTRAANVEFVRHVGSLSLNCCMCEPTHSTSAVLMSRAIMWSVRWRYYSMRMLTTPGVVKSASISRVT